MHVHVVNEKWKFGHGEEVTERVRKRILQE